MPLWMHKAGLLGGGPKPAQAGPKPPKRGGLAGAIQKVRDRRAAQPARPGIFRKVMGGGGGGGY